MTKIRLMVELEVSVELSKDTRDSVSLALQHDVSEASFISLAKSLPCSNNPHGLTGDIHVEEIESTDLVTSLAVRSALTEAVTFIEARSATHTDVAKKWSPEDQDQAAIDYGLAAGYQGAAEYLREKIEDL